MMLIELATPATANTDTAAAPNGNDTTQSSPGMAVRRIAASSSQTASSAEKAVASNRREGLTFLVRSSARPATKAGMPQASSRKACSPDGASRNQSTVAPARAPARMPSPPMRGTGITWNFCGPDKS